VFKRLKLLKKTGNGRLNNLNDPNRPHCVKGLYGTVETGLIRISSGSGRGLL
jgi:hypothetical protein